MGRFVPTRAGIINLWDYRDEEFVFADGWLALRGPNGSGKTKALEVLFPFVLDGRIDPKRLNPFASDDRTMKANLLYRGQDTAYGYVWLELAREGGGVEGNGSSGGARHTVTVGVGMHGQRHRDAPTRWYFVADGRVGVDFSLLGPDDRPLTKKELTAEIGPEAVKNTPTEHRAAVDARLFGLGRERYEQLLTLILTLRRPQLAKNLDPVKLSQTLADGLRPLDDELIAEASRSFDDLEAVQRTLEGLVLADEAARSFLSTYTTYLRTHARAAADGLATRRASVRGRRDDLAAAASARESARAAGAAAEERVREAELAVGRLRGNLDQLKASRAYRAHEQLADLARLVHRLAKGATDARAQLDRRRSATERCRRQLTDAERRLAELESGVSRLAAALAGDAADAGIGWSPDDAVSEGFADRVTARATARTDDVRAVRAALTAFRQAERDRDLAASRLRRAEEEAAAAEAAERRAAEAVESAREGARQRLAAWADRHGATLDELAVPGLVERLASGLDAIGEPDAASLRTVFDAHTAEAVQDRRDEAHRLRTERDRLGVELAEAHEERRLIAAEKDDAPRPSEARSASRADRPGAPLWRLVRFADELSDAHGAAIEAGLHAANLLDAWVHPAAAATRTAVGEAEADGYLVPLPTPRRPSGGTLGDVLVPEEQDDVPTERVQAILASVALADVLGGDGRDGAAGGDGWVPRLPTVTRDGGFAQGVQVGAYGKAAPEYVGATARARRRAARLAEYDRRIAELTQRRDETGRLLALVQTVLDAVLAAQRELPRTGAITDALRHHAEAAGHLKAKRADLDRERAALDQALAEVAARDRTLRKTSADRSVRLVDDPERAVDELAAAVGRFEGRAGELSVARGQADTGRDALAGARDRLDEASHDEALATAAAEDAEREHAEEAAKLETLRETAGVEAEEVLARVRRTEDDIRAATREEKDARGADKDAVAAIEGARTAERAAVDALTVAVTEEHAEARQLAPYAMAELLALLRCPPELTWPAQPGDWRPAEEIGAELARHLAGGRADAPAADRVDDPEEESPTLPTAVVALHDAILAATKDLTPTEVSLKQNATRLAKALDELPGQLSAAGQDYRPEWDSSDGVIVVRVAEEDGFSPVGRFAERVAVARRDQEQLLAESERRVFEDALLSRLAQQVHERTIDARDLIRAMNTEMRARRMSSGVTVGVRWELADHLDEEQRAVCRVLEADATRLGPDDLARMRRHFAGQIKTARARHRDRSYRELLAEVLDYRRWRTFVFHLIRPDGAEDRLTRVRHSQLSGGEQSVSLHLPLFAAAHAMLNSARPDSPRLLGLDEAFAGVDDTGRAELMGLAIQFDLDLFMTGYDLWATYATVPMAAHYDLSHSPTEHTVSALLMVWDGREVVADASDGNLTAQLGSPGTRRRPRRSVGGLLDDLDDNDKPDGHDES